MTHGRPGSVKPATSSGGAPPGVAERCSAASYQMSGTRRLRCISFETSGFPDAECAPDTAQLFEPARQSLHEDVARREGSVRRASGFAKFDGSSIRDCVLRSEEGRVG